LTKSIYIARLISSFIIILLPSLCTAQSGILSGVVTCNNKPVEYATVRIIDGFGATRSDGTGYYSFEGLGNGDYEIMVTMIGYKPLMKSCKIVAGNAITLNLNLESTSDTLNKLVVSATLKAVHKLESPVPIDVYTEDFFKSNPAPSIFESLQNINGVRPQLNCNVCNTGDIHINGLEGPYTMVLLDGMPIVSGLSTVYGLTGIPQALIERVEIVKGPASTLYGSEAVGGLINIITKKPSNLSRITADVFATGWGEINTDLGLTYKASKTVDGLIGINYFNYQNPMDNNGDGFTDLTLQNRISIFNKFNIKRKKNRIFSLAGRYVYEDRWGGEMNWSKAFRGGEDIYGESIYTNRWEAFGVYELPIDAHVNFQFSLNGHQQNSVYGSSIYLADQYIGFGQLTWNLEGPIHDVLLGGAYRYTFYDDNTPATAGISLSENEPSITHLPGLFVQDQINLNENNTVLLGMRYDYNSLHGNIFTPRINYKWQTSDNKHTLRIGGGNGYRVANVFTEDHAALTGARTVEFNGTLKPEISWNGNMNFVKKIFTSKGTPISIDASAFYTYFTNRILPDYETDPNKIIYGNLNGNSISKGVSLNVDVTFNNGIKLLTGATLMDVSVEENGERTRQILTESFQGVWSASYTFQKLNLTINYTGNLYGPMRLPLLGALDNRSEYSPWWSIQNIQLIKGLGKQWEIYGGVKNLLNFTPDANSIARAFDPFDKGVTFDQNGQVQATPNNPNALTFDPSYVYAANQGIRGFLGVRYTLK